MWLVARRRRSRGSRAPRQTTASTGARRGRGRRSWKDSFDVDHVAGEILGEVAARLGVEGVVDPAVLKDILSEFIAALVESRSSKPTMESIVKRIVAAREGILKALAARLLEEPEKLDREQLEFIVANAPELAGRAAPALYEVALRLGADDVIDALRSLWLQYGRPTPIKCPRCGFHAVAPDLSCIVCGAQLSEEEVKRSIGFDALLEEFAERADVRLVEEAASAGYVLVDGEVHAPSERPLLQYYVELYLSREERERLRRVLAVRKLQA